MIQVKAQETNPNDERKEKLCLKCNKMKHTRWDCRECDFTICPSCFLSQNGPAHGHQTFLVTVPYHTALKAVRTGFRRQCGSGRCTDHCHQCGCCKLAGTALKKIPRLTTEVMALNEVRHACKDCLFNFDDSILVCDKCYPECRHFYNQGYCRISYRFRFCTNKEVLEICEGKKAIFRCTECPCSKLMPFSLLDE
jgi:hypothetical protein